MNRVAPALLALAVLLAQLSCASSDTPSAGMEVLTGRIYTTGNEPFTSLALETPSGDVYLLKCAPEIERTLSRRQGEIMKIYYREIAPEGSRKTLRVLKAEPAGTNAN